MNQLLNNPQEVTKLIMDRISLLGKARLKLSELANAKAEAVRVYHKALALKVDELSGSYPATLTITMAKGAVADQRFEREKSEAVYKALIVAINALQAELNGLQSINKYQKEV